MIYLMIFFKTGNWGVTHGVADVGSSTISGISETANDARKFSLSNTISSVLK